VFGHGKLNYPGVMFAGNITTYLISLKFLITILKMFIEDTPGRFKVMPVMIRLCGFIHQTYIFIWSRFAQNQFLIERCYICAKK
jgi:hypothetical protein